MPIEVLQKITYKVKFAFGGITMKLREYIDSLDSASISAYAARCQIAVSYLRLHVKYASKDPSVSLIKSLTRESEGCVSLADVLEHFGITEKISDKAA